MTRRHFAIAFTFAVLAAILAGIVFLAPDAAEATTAVLGMH